MDKAIEDAKAIESETAQVNRALTQVQDRTPWWATLIHWGLIVAVIGGVIWLLSATGLLAPIRLAIAWAMSFLPTPTTRRAEMDAEALTRGQVTPQAREAIAVSRTDPTYEAAFKRSRQRAKAEVSATPTEDSP